MIEAAPSAGVALREMKRLRWPVGPSVSKSWARNLEI